MTNQYSYMDDWSERELNELKERTINVLSNESAEEGFTPGLASNTKDLKFIVEGDSWCDYKVSADLVDCLVNYHGYKIKNYADPRDTLENMIYGTKTTRNYKPRTPQIEKVLKKNQQHGAGYLFLLRRGE